MKRLIVLTILVITATSMTGCRRWGLRGARCGAPAPAYTPVPAYPPAPAYAPPACPPVSCPPVTCPTAYDVCPTVPYNTGYGGFNDGTVIDGGSYSVPSTVIEGSSGAAFQAPSIEGLPSPTFDRSTFNLPGGRPGVDLTKQVVPNKPIFSHVIGDRKLEPGESIKRAYELPVESAAATTSEKK